MADDVESLKKHIRTYLLVFAALGVLTVLTVWASYLPVSTAWHVVIALFIASIKAGLVAAFFMHLTSEKKLIYQIMIFTVFFFLGLIFLTILAYKDHIPSLLG
ncbi:MAG: cytochrome C oxidase subunit IV family protein [Verrucomicrobiales bacterium]